MEEHSAGKALVPDASTRLAAERTRLAYGRTLLGWIRTAVSLITFGFSIHQFFRIARAGAVESEHRIGPREFGLLMIAIGLVSLLMATLENRRDIKALKAQYPDLHDSSEPVLSLLVAILGIAAVLVILLRL
ncbi:YidH family protein [Verrucomicrobiota bacterium sgz303538]